VISPIADIVGPLATGEYGPRNMRKFGILETPIPIYDSGFEAFQRSCRFFPSHPMTGKRGMKDVLNPVAHMIISARCSLPNSSMQPFSVKDDTPALTNTTLECFILWRAVSSECLVHIGENSVYFEVSCIWAEPATSHTPLGNKHVLELWVLQNLPHRDFEVALQLCLQWGFCQI
jgi:hypothetical protein